MIRTWHIGGTPCYHRAHACGQFWRDPWLQGSFDGWHARREILARMRGIFRPAGLSRRLQGTAGRQRDQEIAWMTAQPARNACGS
jgi:hypothetical protein